LAVTDRNSLCGVVQAHVAAKEAKLRLLAGAEITPRDGPAVLLYATDRAAYGRLSRLITVGRRRAEKGACDLAVKEVCEHAAGLIGIVVPQTSADAAAALSALKDAFGARLYLAAEFHLGADDKAKFARLRELARRCSVPLVAANDVYYHDSGRRFLQDVLACIRHGCTLQAAGSRLFPNAERRLKSATEMQALLTALLPARGSRKEVEQFLSRSVEIVSACRFSLDELRYEYPQELTPRGTTPLRWLSELTWAGAKRCWPNGVPEKVRRQIEHELQLIEELHYEAYFLTVWDLVAFARSRNILCQGRGSAANSAVCFCLGITAVGPARADVLFERFMSRERAEAPDIDVDFEHERREEVMQYVYEKYGRERAGITAEVITYRPKSAVRDVGKALGLSLDRVDLLAGTLDHFEDAGHITARIREAGLDPEDRTMRQLVALCRELLGFPRHLSQHVGGFVITAGPLCELVPIENASMADRTVIEWDKDDIDALGILKVDCLALGMLTALHKCLELVNARRARTPPHVAPSPASQAPPSPHVSQSGRMRYGGEGLTLATIPPEDPRVYDRCCRADTVGVFQIESRAQMAMLPRLKPRCFYDLVVEVSIVRPGPIQGGMVHPYLRRRAGEEQVTYPNAAIKGVLEKTLGIPLFQEQVMRLAMVAAGFTPGEADKLRRAMGSWRRPGLIEQLRERMLAGMLRNGLPLEYAERVFEQIRGFGEYGFPESHAASFALLVYASAWLKCYHQAAFTCALLNSQPMGFYAPAQLVRDAQAHGVTVKPVDVNHSLWDCTLEGENEIRLGFRMVKGLSREKHVEAIVRARTGGTLFGSIAEFARRTGLTKAVLSRVAAADAFQGLGVDRRTALWQVLALHEELPLFQALEAEEPAPQLSAAPPEDEVTQDYETTGLSLKAHPLALLRADLEAAGLMTCAQLRALKDGAWARVAGLVLVRQRPDTASGVIFVTIEDETGTANLIVWPSVYERHRKAARMSTALIVEGTWQREGDVTHVVVKRLRDLSESLPELRWRSRDFR
ncbi:MAG: error-prone DNA polymerase, partial [Planctomycetota bacterium]|nr:error-prone DNA polymerase [Planctomycetota bacterium]